MSDLKEALARCPEKSLKKLFPVIAKGLDISSELKNSSEVSTIIEAVEAIDEGDRESTSKEIVLMIESYLKEKRNKKNLVPLKEGLIIPASLAIKHEATEEDRKKVIESVRGYINGLKLTESESKRVTEAFEAVKPKTKWSFPISRCDVVNGNGRRYSKSLWEKVIKEQANMYNGSVGLADHPIGDSDPMFKDSAVVWSNLRIEEGRMAPGQFSTIMTPIVWADAIFVGPHGQLAEDILEAGGKVGFSTAGLGELNRVRESIGGDYQEFDDVTYLFLERPADIVPNPSQDVFGFLEMKMKESEDSSEFSGAAPEKVVSVTEPGQKKTDENIKESKKEGFDMLNEKTTGGASNKQNPMNKLEERRYREDITRFLEKTSEVKDPHEKLKELNEVKSYVESLPEDTLTDVRESINKAIESASAEVKAAYENGSKFVEAFGKDFKVEDVQKTLNELSTMKQDLYESTHDWKVVAEKLAAKLKTFVEAVDVLKDRPTQKSYEETLRTLEAQKKEIQVLKARIAESEKEYGKRYSQIKENVKEYMNKTKFRFSQADVEIKSLKELVGKLQKDKATLAARANDVILETMGDESRYLVESGAQISAKMKNRLKENSRISNFATSKAFERDKAEVHSYYKKLVEMHGRKILPFKEQILKANNYKEAVTTYLNLSERMQQGYDRDLILDIDNPTIWEYLTNT